MVETLRPLILVGPMGAGKTTIGKQLSSVLRRDFIDSDHEIVRRTGANIPLIFEIEGEDGFRRRETSVIEDLTLRQGIVIATGGGAVIRPENRQLMRERGTVIYLRASIDQLMQRTRGDKNRPLLQTADPRARLLELLTAREPLYKEVANIILYTDERSVRSVVREIITRLEELDRG
jgi:shikimate kinase